jgi:hypothetical protein
MHPLCLVCFQCIKNEREREKYICNVSISSESDLHRDRLNVRRKRRRALKNPSLKFTSVSERGSKTDKFTGKKKQKKEECKVDMFAHRRI